MRDVTLIFPHQLFEKHPALSVSRNVVLVEEYLFFRQFKFHKQKLAFHRASMLFYKQYLENKGFKVLYVESHEAVSDVRLLIPHLRNIGTKEIHYCHSSDDWLEKRISDLSIQEGVKLVEYKSLLFLNSTNELLPYFGGRGKFFQTDFYVQQRKTRGILVDKDLKPIGGKWSYDADNRSRFPKNKIPPLVDFPLKNTFTSEAKLYVEKYFLENPGELNGSSYYPSTFDESRSWLNQFLERRFIDFGIYEDAIVTHESILNHSVLTPVLNVGLITVDEVVSTSLRFASEKGIPVNSVEGFIRQLIGWREFIRGVYEFKGRSQRTVNFWKFKRKIPQSFWDGRTGIEPVDIVIKRVLETGYCHHIERLMILGNFMLLCEFDPDEVYRWFMEMFIDAYDWVMVPNVYGMSQFADGGLMATKPYISGSNYLMKMSDFPKGPWQGIWDGLFWRFMHLHREFFVQNPRLGMLVRTFDKMDPVKRKHHLAVAEDFLKPI